SAFRSKHAEKNLKQADDLIGSIRVLELNAECSRKSSEILSELLSRGLSVGIRDAIIAGISLANGCTLVTRNLEHFKRITGLGVESW
ncbi:MAG: type II toxin-antitoxin system VapC family toxin, partial [Thermoproteota archaeon]